MRVLVACEESQAVCKAFRERGHEAYSCDLQSCSGGHPEWHIIGDCLGLINGNCTFTTEGGQTVRITETWDILIAHPPCTYMSGAGACRMYPRKGEIDAERFAKAMDAKQFFMRFLNADCERICVENPKPLKCVELPRESQCIQPYAFGEPWSKTTYLWLKGLPPLMATCIVNDYKPYISCGTSRNKGNKDKAGVGRSSKIRSKTFPGIAKAMADQWG